MMDDFIAARFKAVFDRHGYVLFDKGDYNLNLIGVRRSNNVANEFDDFFVTLYKVKGAWRYNWYYATTDAGKFYLENPIVKQGCALLKEGQYRGAYQIGMHKGQYEALVQRKPVTVYRDNNRDTVLDLGSPTETGIFGINIHKGSDFQTNYTVDKWSAGCQVIQNVSDFHEVMRLCRHSANLYGNTFTYTLLNEKDFD